jgi:putative hemolysin
MMKKARLCCILMMLTLFIVGCDRVIEKPRDNSTDKTNSTSLNQSGKLYPSIRGFDIFYCEGLGYTYEYRQDQNGTYKGYCRLTKDIECPSDDFADGLCHREHTLCEIKGYILKIGVEQQGNTTVTYPICIFPDNSYCRELDFFNRKCYVKW